MKWSWKWAAASSMIWFGIIQAVGALVDHLYPGILNDKNTTAVLGWIFIVGIVVICWITVRKYYKEKKKLEQQQRPQYPQQPQPQKSVL